MSFLSIPLLLGSLKYPMDPAVVFGNIWHLKHTPTTQSVVCSLKKLSYQPPHRPIRFPESVKALQGIIMTPSLGMELYAQ